MKPILLIILWLFISYHSYSQKIYSTEKDVYNTNEIVFYGYDYSHFKMADAKRMGQDIKSFIFDWIAYSRRGMSEKDMSSRTCLNKEKITYNFDPTFELIKGLKSQDLVSLTTHNISKDSIQSFIDKYKINEKEGIGFVIIIECFDKYHKTVSGYCTFFDIASKRILMTDYFSSKNSNNYNNVNDWSVAIGIAIREYMWTYYRRINDFKSNNN